MDNALHEWFKQHRDFFAPKGSFCGISVGPGWEPLVLDTLNKLYECAPLEICQIKEKFGGLRIYWWATNIDYTQVDNIILEAEELASRTCEQCGQEAYLCIRSGWFKTLCTDCAEELGYTCCDKRKDQG
jgi:hypothetical protein